MVKLKDYMNKNLFEYMNKYLKQNPDIKETVEFLPFKFRKYFKYF